MRSLTRVRTQLFALLGGGAAVVAGVACGGSVETSGAAGASGTLATGTTGGVAGFGAEAPRAGSGGTGRGGGGIVEASVEGGDCDKPHDAGSTEPECVDYTSLACFGAEALFANMKDPPPNPGSCTPALATCPAWGDLKSNYACGGVIYSGSLSEGRCCYAVIRSVDGRPFVVDGERRCASVADRADWCAAWHDQRDDLEPALRARLTETWLEDAALEHASVASFARLSLHLLCLGAPPELLLAAQKAALDEIEHARLCYQLASRYAGRPLGPGPLAIDGAVTDVTLSELAVAAVEEGCVGETLAAVLAGERSEQASDPEARAVLARIAEDETRHAELAWRTVKWAIEQGGTSVAKAVELAFAKAVAPYRHGAPASQAESENDVLRAHGRVTQSSLQRIACVVVREIVLPMAARLQTRGAVELQPSLPVDVRAGV